MAVGAATRPAPSERWLFGLARPHRPAGRDHGAPALPARRGHAAVPAVAGTARRRTRLAVVTATERIKQGALQGFFDGAGKALGNAKNEGKE